MNEDSLDVLRKTIQQDGFFETIVVNVNDWGEALDRRDDDEFDKVWSSAFEKLKALEYLSAADEIAVNEMREYVFKRVYSLTSNSDVAGYISDDIGLVADSILKACDIKWVNELLDSYHSGRFPN